MNREQIGQLEMLFVIFVSNKLESQRKLSVKEIMQYAFILEEIRIELRK